MGTHVILTALRIEYPELIQQDSDGKWFWENIDGDRFTFDTPEAAAEDVAVDMDYTHAEAVTTLLCRGVPII